MSSLLPSFSLFFALGALWSISVPQSATAKENTTAAAKDFVRNYETNVVPLEISLNRAWWDANTTGSDEAFAAKEALDKQMNELLSSKEEFQKLKSIQAGTIDDPQLAREIEILYLTYLNRQGDLTLLNRMSAKANEIEKKFNQFRATVGEKSFTDSQVREVMLNSKDSAEREQIWKANKDVGGQVAVDLQKLVLMRNEAARKLGFKN